MRYEQIKIFKYSELNGSAQARARDYFALTMDYPWFSECIESINKFCDQFNVKIENYRIDPEDYRGSFIKTNADNLNFRGYKLADAKKLLNSEGNGFFVYFDLTNAFYQSFKQSGDPKNAFFEALQVGIRSIESDIEAKYSKEYLEDFIEANEYEFLESGDLH